MFKGLRNKNVGGSIKKGGGKSMYANNIKLNIT